MSLKKEIAKSNVLISGSKFLAFILAFVFNILLARILGPEGFGIYSFFMTVATFFLVLTDPGVRWIIVRFLSEFYSEEEYGKVRRVFRKILSYQLFLVLSISAALFIFNDWIAVNVFGKPNLGWVIVMAVPVIGFLTLGRTFSQTLTALKDFEATAAYFFSESFLRLVIVLGVVLLGYGVLGALGGTVLMYMILISATGLVLWWRHSDVFSGSEKITGERDVRRFGAWIMFATLLSYLYISLDEFLVAALVPVADIGFYRIAKSAVMAIVTVVPITAAVMYPYLSSSPSDLSKKMLYHSMKYLAIFATPLAFMLSALAHPFVTIFYGTDYTAAVVPLEILSFFIVPFVMASILEPYYWSQDRPKTVAGTLFGSTVIMIGLLLALTGPYGLAGAAFAVLIGKTLETLVLLFIGGRGLEKIALLVKPFAASLVIYLVAGFLPTGGILELFLTVGGLGILYIVLMMVMGGLNREDIDTLRSVLG